MICSCGNPKNHEVARGYTFDGIAVCLWDDGMLSGLMGFRLQGVPSRRPRTPEAREQALITGRLLLGDVMLYDVAELSDLYRAAERTAKGDCLPGTMRAEFVRLQRPAPPTLKWIVVAADRDGKPTERYAIIPDMDWYVVWDYCGGRDSSQGRYRLMTIHRERHRDPVCKETGLVFRNLDALWGHLNWEKNS